jgi:uncharacterized membrane protein YkvA (DUF1232 family)
VRVSWDVVLRIVIGLAGLWLLFIGLVWILKPRNASLGELLRLVPDVVRLVRDLLRDRSVPAIVRVALVFLLAWIVSPIDLIPEFIPVIGPLDDAVMVVVVLRFVRRRIGEVELRRRWRGTDEGYALLNRLLGGA